MSKIIQLNRRIATFVSPKTENTLVLAGQLIRVSDATADYFLGEGQFEMIGEVEVPRFQEVDGNLDTSVDYDIEELSVANHNAKTAEAGKSNFLNIDEIRRAERDAMDDHVAPRRAASVSRRVQEEQDEPPRRAPMRSTTVGDSQRPTATRKVISLDEAQENADTPPEQSRPAIRRIHRSPVTA